LKDGKSAISITAILRYYECREMTKTPETAVFTVTFRKGLADRHRLPLDHVIRTLQELDSLIRELGRQVQRERGVEHPTGDFGIELLAGPSGVVFRKGSLKAAAAVTKDLDNADIALARLMATADLLEKKQPASIDMSGAPIIRHFARISGVQKQDHTELKFEWKKQGARVKSAKFTDIGIQTIESISATGFTVEQITLYGKLRELVDLTKEDEEGKAFWGELVTDNGESWRVKFADSDLRNVLPLFRHQVAITGDATYFKAKNPRLVAQRVIPDPERDYVGAFDKYHGSDGDVFGETEVSELLKELRS
jgi:hypothetical protein